MKKARESVKRIDMTLTGLRELRRRIDRQQIETGDWTILGALVSKLIAREEANQERMKAKATADAVKSSAENGRIIDAEFTSRDPNSTSSDSVADPKPGASEADGSADKSKPKDKPKGHGRNGAAAFTNAKHVLHRLLGVIGVLCEFCRGGPMSAYREKIVIRIVGQPLFGAEIHHHEQARCRICHRIIRATAPASVLEGVGTSYIVYDYSSCAMLIVMHYFGGAPFKRLESLHEGWGVPMPDSNQWNLADASDDLLLPLYRTIELHGIRKATSLRIDDTGSMIVETAKQIRAEIEALQLLGESTKDVRTGINATGVYLETPDGTTILFYTGRHHAGEIIDQIIKHRSSESPKLSKVTDGAAKNFDHSQSDKLVESTCHAHAFLKFRAIKNQYPTEYAVVGEIYSKIFDHDDEAKARSLDPFERMLYHRYHSKPLMEKLKAMCAEKLESKLVEPRSLLWEPIGFIINQWPRLTKFYEEPGVPLDTNLVEQTLIIPVRYLAASFNYHTENGAEVGDRLMSIVVTARANDVEPVAYLTECLRNHEDLAKRPEYYLPWVVRERNKRRELDDPQPSANVPDEPRVPGPRVVVQPKKRRPELALTASPPQS